MGDVEGEVVSAFPDFVRGDVWGGFLDVSESDADFLGGWLGQVLGATFHLCQGIEEEVSFTRNTGVLSLWRRRDSGP